MLPQIADILLKRPLKSERAAEICTGSGCEMVIANGREPNNLYGILQGQDIGTRFVVK